MSEKLKTVDLNKRQDGTHPDVSVDKSYLAKIRGKWYAGTFRVIRYSNYVTFALEVPVYRSKNYEGYQLDWDGWEELYEIVE